MYNTLLHLYAHTPFLHQTILLRPLLPSHTKKLNKGGMLMKQSPVGMRTKSSKGLKVKHVMQTFLLLVISIWLIYQLKHSYDKKAAATAAAMSMRGHGVPSEQETLRLGRKDLLHPVGTSRSETDDQLKSEEIEGQGRVGAEEEEPEEVEDLIDVEDRDNGNPNIIDSNAGSLGNENDELKSSI